MYDYLLLLLLPFFPLLLYLFSAAMNLPLMCNTHSFTRTRISNHPLSFSLYLLRPDRRFISFQMCACMSMYVCASVYVRAKKIWCNKTCFTIRFYSYFCLFDCFICFLLSFNYFRVICFLLSLFRRCGMKTPKRLSGRNFILQKSQKRCAKIM